MLILALVRPPLFRGGKSYFIASLCTDMGNMLPVYELNVLDAPEHYH